MLVCCFVVVSSKKELHTAHLPEYCNHGRFWSYCALRACGAQSGHHDSPIALAYERKPNIVLTGSSPCSDASIIHKQLSVGFPGPKYLNNVELLHFQIKGRVKQLTSHATYVTLHDKLKIVKFCSYIHNGNQVWSKTSCKKPGQ